MLLGFQLIRGIVILSVFFGTEENKGLGFEFQRAGFLHSRVCLIRFGTGKIGAG